MCACAQTVVCGFQTTQEVRTHGSLFFSTWVKNRTEPCKNPHALAALVRTRVVKSLKGTTTRAAAATRHHMHVRHLHVAARSYVIFIFILYCDYDGLLPLVASHSMHASPQRS